MLTFSLFFEKYDTVKDFLTDPSHNDKKQHEWYDDFIASGGKVLGSGGYGAVYSHPKWPYVVKIFNSDDPYLKFVRYAYTNPHKSFPKFYGLPKRFIPPYKRTYDIMVKPYAVRIEKLNPISDEIFQKLSYYRWTVARYLHFKTDPNAMPQNLMQGELEEMEKTVNDLPPDVYSLLDAMYRLGKVQDDTHSWGADDWKKNNIMMRDNGDLVIIDPVWEGDGGPYAVYDRAMRAEIDQEWDDGEPEEEPKVIRGGKLGQKKRKKKPKPFIYEPYSKPDPKDDDIPF